MSLRSTLTTLRHNPALGVALFIPLLSVVVASTLLTFAIGAQRDSAKAAAATRIDLPLPPMSKTSWREPEPVTESGDELGVGNSLQPGVAP